MMSLNFCGATFKLPPLSIEFLNMFILFLYLNKLEIKLSMSVCLAPNFINDWPNTCSFLNPGKTILPFLITSGVFFIKFTIMSLIILGLSTT